MSKGINLRMVATIRCNSCSASMGFSESLSTYGESMMRKVSATMFRKAGWQVATEEFPADYCPECVQHIADASAEDNEPLQLQPAQE